MPRPPGGGGIDGGGGGKPYPGNVAVNAALACVGTPYQFGGCQCHVGLDCSCLVRNAWRTAGKSIPRTTFLQYPALRPVSRNNLAPGDLLYYYMNDGGPGPGHVVMYIGGGQVVEAAHSGTRVSTHAVSWSGFVGARRPFGLPAYGGSGGGSIVKGPQTLPCLPGGKCPKGYVNAQAVTSGGGGRTSGTTGKCVCTRRDVVAPTGGLNPLGGLFPSWLSPHGLLRGSQILGGFFLIVVALLLIAADVLRGPVGKAAGAVVSKGPAGRAIKAVGARSQARERNAEADFKAEAASAAGTRSESRARDADDRAGRVRGSQTAGVGGARPKPGSRIKAKR